MQARAWDWTQRAGAVSGRLAVIVELGLWLWLARTHWVVCWGQLASHRNIAACKQEAAGAPKPVWQSRPVWCKERVTPSQIGARGVCAVHFCRALAPVLAHDGPKVIITDSQVLVTTPYSLLIQSRRSLSLISSRSMSRSTEGMEACAHGSRCKQPSPLRRPLLHALAV